MLELEDTFDADAQPGRVIGTRATSGHPRLVTDRERSISIDHGALRIPYLLDHGWGRAGIAYGPIAPRPGTALVVQVTNGLNTSQSPELPEGRRAKVARVRRTFPRVQWDQPRQRESLAVGWFPSPDADPRSGGLGFVITATPRALADLLVVAGGRSFPAVRDLQNLPVTFVIVRREGSSLLLAASTERAHGIGQAAGYRPLAVVDDRAASLDGQAYPGVHQAVLGEVKYRVATRLHGVRVVHDDALAPSRFASHAVMEPSPADGRDKVVVDPPSPTGLIRTRVTGPDLELRFRSGWAFVTDRAGGAGSSLVRPDGTIAATSGGVGGGAHDVQVLDDGTRIAVVVDGELVCEAEDEASADGTAVSARAHGGVVELVETFPRAVVLPPPLTMPCPSVPEGGAIAVSDDFGGPACELGGTVTPVGGVTWARVLGRGVFDRTGAGAARVRADRATPNPGRTLYVVPWGEPDFADVGVSVTPPGSARGEGHQGRSGLVLWQDADNHFAVNHFIDDGSVGVSISAFLRTGGHEEMYDYDATWSNVDGRIRQGVAHRLRVVCDGVRFVCFVDGEPVLLRAFTDYRAEAQPLRINGVGLLANWEWGDDTGSVFEDFVARGR